MSEILREFLVQGSVSLPYKVVFKRNGTDLKGTCGCRAGISGLLCKHRLSILDGDKSAVVSENIHEVAEVASWLAGSSLGAAISELVSLEAEKRSLEEKIKRARKLVSKALIYP